MYLCEIHVACIFIYCIQLCMFPSSVENVRQEAAGLQKSQMGRHFVQYSHLSFNALAVGQYTTKFRAVHFGDAQKDFVKGTKKRY